MGSMCCSISVAAPGFFDIIGHRISMDFGRILCLPDSFKKQAHTILGFPNHIFVLSAAGSLVGKIQKKTARCPKQYLRHRAVDKLLLTGFHFLPDRQGKCIEWTSVPPEGMR